MKTLVQVRFGGNDVVGGAQAILGPAGCDADVAVVDDVPALRRIFVKVTLEDGDERLPRLLHLLSEQGVRRWERRWDVYADEELESARLLVMSYDPNARVFGGPRMGTTYDMSQACKRCGAGARQTSAMIIEGEDLHKLEGRCAAMTSYDDLLVDQKLAAAIAESGPTGISFRGVFAAFEKRGHIQLPWQQICATRTMPPMSSRSTGIELDEPCPCGRSCFSGKEEEPLRLAYRAADLADIHDVNVTWEWYGFSKFNGNVADSVLPYPLFLVTPKIWRVFKDASVTGFDWLPIRVEDE